MVLISLLNLSQAQIHVASTLTHYGDEVLILGFIESSYRDNLPVGPAGEIGVLQVTPPAYETVIKSNPDYDRNTLSYTEAGAIYFKRLSQKHGLKKAIIAYNAGEGRIDNPPESTKNYLFKFMSLYNLCNMGE